LSFKVMPPSSTVQEIKQQQVEHSHSYRHHQYFRINHPIRRRQEAEVVAVQSSEQICRQAEILTDQFDLTRRRQRREVSVVDLHEIGLQGSRSLARGLAPERFDAFLAF